MERYHLNLMSADRLCFQRDGCDFHEPKLWCLPYSHPIANSIHQPLGIPFNESPRFFRVCMCGANPQAEASKPAPSPQNVLEILRHFMKSDRSLDEDPFYTVAYKATTAAAAKAAKAAAAARAAAKAATDALVSERVAAATKKAADEAATVEANNAKLLAASVAAAAADNTKAANTAAAARSKQALHHQQAAAAGGSSNNVRSGPGSSSAPVVPGASVAKPESVVRTAEHRGASMGAAASAFVGALADGPVLGAPGGGGGSSCSSGVVDAGVVGAAARPVEEKPPEKR